MARIFDEMADLMEISGENPFRIRSYRNAARTLDGLTRDIHDLLKNEDDITSLPGIGKNIAQKIREIADTGKLRQLEELKKKVPESLIDIMNLEQLGPQRTRLLNSQLGIKSISDLKKAVEEGKLEKIRGFGKKTSENIKRGIREYSSRGGSKRIKWSDAEMYIQPLLRYLGLKLENVIVAGSYRRKEETVGDIDILATSRNPEQGMDEFVKYEDTERIINKGKTKTSVKLRRGLQVDLRIVDTKAYGAALLYFTGSKAHNIALRKIGQAKKLKINEYGVFKNEKRIAGKTEKEIYKLLGMSYIEPEMRENRGEIKLAEMGKLPKLVTLEDIRGDLQTHTNETDGRYSLEEMAGEAEKFGYEYYAVTDHSKRVSMAHGLDEKRLAGQIEKIDELNRKMKRLRILKSIEVDILEDGKLDLPDSILKELDLVVCAVHYNRNLSKEKQTTRILKAMDNPYFNILAHPTGRLLNERNAYAVDMERIMREAVKNGCFLEINSQPDRLDLNDNYIRMARDLGLRLAISTDAHTTGNLGYMKYGIAQARRGWLEKKDVINTYPWHKLKKLLKRK